MQKSATINMRVGILLASVAVFCVPISVSADMLGFSCSNYVEDGNQTIVYIADGESSEGMSVCSVSYDDTGVYNGFVDFHLSNDCSDSESQGYQFRFYENTGSEQFSALVIPNASVDKTYNSVDVHLQDALFDPVADYCEDLNVLAGTPLVFTHLPEGTSSSSSSSSTPEEVTAATGVASLGFISFMGGFAITTWMWRRFLA